MAELKRSVTSFRRQGSSGLVWNNKFVSEVRDPHQAKPGQEDNGDQREEARELRQSQRVGTIGLMARSQSAGATPARRVKVAPPSEDPPSPKLSTCGFFCFPVVQTHKLYRSSKKRR